MNYFVCTYGDFSEKDEMVERSLKEKVYLLHQYARYPSAIDNVDSGDVLLLNQIGHGVVAFAISAGRVSHRDEADEWNYVLTTRDGWHKGKNAQYSAYGISWATLQGGQFSLVKRVEAAWAEKILADMGWVGPSQESDTDNPDVPFRDMTPRLVAKELMDGELDIPPVQRRFVWNATRLEVLWDSIMRNIPIGTFSIRAKMDECGKWTKQWDLLDGQQRATAIMSAYRSFPPEPTLVEMRTGDCNAKRSALQAPVVWIDLLPSKMYGRKYVFRVTTAAHPWGYNLTDDETSNSRIEEKYKRDISDKFDWCNKGDKALLSEAVKPYPSELMPHSAECPVPFSLILECCEKMKSEGENKPNPTVDDFIVFCRQKKTAPSTLALCHNGKSAPSILDGLCPWNWFDADVDGFVAKVESSREAVENVWNALVRQIYDLADYRILEVNAKSVSTEDVGVYFKRIGRGGEVPTQEEMNYSMLKSKLPALKKSMDSLSESGWASPSRMATLALYAWQMRNPGVTGSIETLINKICENEDYQKSFSAYASGEDIGKDAPSFMQDLKALDELLGIDSGGLLPWHRMIFSTRANGDLCRYLLRLVVTKQIDSDKLIYAGLASFIYYYSDTPSRLIGQLMDAKSVHDGIISAYRDSYYGKPLLRRLVTPEEVDILIEKVNCEDWIGTWNRIKADPVWKPVVQVITAGYGNERAYSILLFGCREFMRMVFPNYNALLPIWSEENCPWDYDHIFPKDQRGNFEEVAKGCGDVIDSIGNLAPLPFSINRAKHDDFPTSAYPLGAMPNEQEVQQLTEYKRDLVLLGDSEETYDYSKFSCGEMINHKEVFIQTLRRFSHLYRFWFERLGIGSIIPETTKRKDLFERLEKEFDGEEYFTWIPGSNEQERKLDNKPFPFSMVDWISCPWMSFGKCVGKYFVAYGDDGLNTSTVGICKLPEEVEVNKDRHVLFSKFTIPEFTIPTGDKYWYVVKKFNERPCVTEIRNDMQKLIDFLQNAEE